MEVTFINLIAFLGFVINKAIKMISAAIWFIVKFINVETASLAPCNHFYLS